MYVAECNTKFGAIILILFIRQSCDVRRYRLVAITMLEKVWLSLGSA